MTEEVWLPIPGFCDYAVSSYGRVRRVVPDSRNHPCRMLIPWIGNHGYQTVGLTRNGSIHRRLVHRLVCLAFHGEPPSPDCQVAHGDGTRHNNRADNLRWATRSENMSDCLIHGTQAAGERHGRYLSPELTPRGEKHGHAKITEDIVREIRAAPPSKGIGRALAAAYGLSPAAVSMIRNRKTWSHVADGGNGG